MPLNKSKGNMYDFVTHTHTHLGGACPHNCCYCSVQEMAKKYPVLKNKYSGEIRMISKELDVNYGTGKVIFIENCNDLFSEQIPNTAVLEILEHCRKFPCNTYVFQTKNPEGYMHYLRNIPDKAILGTTIETNRDIPGISCAPKMADRVRWMKELPEEFQRFVTIEPVLDFDIDALAGMISEIKPRFVNIGADSKGSALPEPGYGKILLFISELKRRGIEIRKKDNLQRLEDKDKKIT